MINNSFPLLYQTFLPHPFQHMVIILLIWYRLFLQPIISTPLVSFLIKRALYQNTFLCGRGTGSSDSVRFLQSCASAVSWIARICGFEDIP